MQIDVYFTSLTQYDPNQPTFLPAKLCDRCLNLEYFQVTGARPMSNNGHFIFQSKIKKISQASFTPVKYPHEN